MAEEIVLKTEIDLGNGAKSLRSLKDDFKETQKELDGLQVGTEDYIKTLQKLGGIKDEIGDLNAEINAFNPEGKVQAFGNVIGGLASGFQAATGAAMLFGEESEDVQKALLKVQAVMAFTEGIKGVMGMKDAFVVLGNVINANPIMFIATIIIGATAAIYGLIKAMDNEEEKQKAVNEEHKRYAEALEVEIDLIKTKNDIVNKAYSNEIELLKARGATLEQINAKEDEHYHARRAQLAYLKGYRGQLTAEESAEYLALTNEKILRSAQYVSKVKTDLEAVTAKNKEELDKQNKDHKDHLAAIQKNIDDGIQIGFDTDQKNYEAAEALKAQRDIDELTAAANQEAAKANIEYEGQQKSLALIEEKRVANEKALQDGLAFAQGANDGMIALSDLYYAAKSANTKKGSAEDLKNAKEQFKVNKAFSIASAIISGLQGVVNGLSAPYPQNIILPILAGLTTAASVAKISSTQFNGGGSATVPTISAPSLGGAPTLNAPQNSNTELAPDGSIKRAVKNEPPMVKAIVVETDITSKQKRVGTLESQASIGTE